MNSVAECNSICVHIKKKEEKKRSAIPKPEMAILQKYSCFLIFIERDMHHVQVCIILPLEHSHRCLGISRQMIDWSEIERINSPGWRTPDPTFCGKESLGETIWYPVQSCPDHLQ